jgi:hypothetical protein
MEFIIELLMQFLMELLLQVIWILFELFAQAIIEVLAEIGLRILGEPFRRTQPIDPFWAGTGYLVYGAIAGGLSLFLPRMFTIPWSLRMLNLIITPVVCGFIMAKVGQLRERRGNRPLRIDTFMYGYLFALAMAAVRFIWR